MKKSFFYCLAAVLGVLFTGCSDSGSKSEGKSNTAAADTMIRALNQGHKSDSFNKLKQIGVVLSMFTNNNNGKLPDGLTALAESGDLTDNKIFIASYDKTSTPANDKTIKSGNTSYAYLGRGLTDRSNSSIPVFIEKPWLLPEGENTLRVLTLDGVTKQVTIANVAGKSCEEIAKILADEAHIQGPDREKLLQNARRIDKNHNKKK